MDTHDTAISRLADLKEDTKNARKHNPTNIGMIEKSIRAVGAARSGVIDENGVILAGNGTFEALSQAGIEKVKVVQADGNEWVVVQRLGLTEAQKRTLALADNRTAELATWDGDLLQSQGIDLQPWFSEAELTALTSIDGLNGLSGEAETLSPTVARETLASRFLVPPFSVLDTRQGYWQERKRAWLALGLQSELGRGTVAPGEATQEQYDTPDAGKMETA